MSTSTSRPALPPSSSPTTSARPSSPPNQPALSAREQAILPLILQHTKDDPSRLQFDWDALAQRMGMTNPRSAANAWLAVRKKITAAPSSSKLTANDHRFLANAVCCTKRQLDVDFAALAAALGMTNPRSASNAWAAIRKKINHPGGGSVAAVGAGGKKADVVVGASKARGKAMARSKEAAAAAAVVGGGNGGARAEALAQSRSLAFKVAKRESSPEEVKPVKHQRLIKPDPEPSAHGSSLGLQGLSAREMHLTAAAEEASYAMDGQVRVKDEPYDDEC